MWCTVGMFKVTFRDTGNERDLNDAPIYLPDIPTQGEAVYFRERGTAGRARSGRVTSRHWHIATKEPGESEVVILVTMDK